MAWEASLPQDVDPRDKGARDMKLGIRGATLSFLLAWLTAGDVSAASAQNFPLRPVKIFTDVGTGGTYDIFARALAEELHKRWHQGVVVEPHPGGNAIIGSRACADAPADGYTLCIMS